jgi:ABC-type taurine transport system ATPase subunit
MARIDLDHIRHSYLAKPMRDQDYALKEVHHSWEDGGAYALLGPSGCGKTTLLNIISGLITPSEGRVLFDGRDVTGLSPEARNVAQVFQFPVVYDTMTVYDNVAFPLRNRGFAEADVDKKVKEILDMLGLTPVAAAKARRLTADMKQKISLGRGLVRSDVNAILFDEPLTGDRLAVRPEDHQMPCVEIGGDHLAGVEFVNTVGQHHPFLAGIIQMHEAFRAGDLGDQHGRPDRESCAVNGLQRQMMRPEADRVTPVGDGGIFLRNRNIGQAF